MSAFLRCLQDTHKSELEYDFEPLAMTNSDAYTEKHLELLNGLLDDLVSEQARFQQYSKSISKLRQEHIRWLLKKVQVCKILTNYFKYI